MIELKRKRNWYSKLAKYLNSVQRKKFVYGDFDCSVGLCAGAVETITGVDLAAEFRGKYTDADGAKAAITSSGFETLGDLVASMLPEITRKQSHTGDIAEVKTIVGEAIGVVFGEVIYVMSKTGTGIVKKSSGTRFFKVGESKWLQQ